jgi:pyridoxal phosphate enzyme (YggS family)
MIDLAVRIEAVQRRILRATERAGRSPESVRLVAVSKRHPADVVRQAYACGLRWFGENYAQELVGKAAEVGPLAGIEWHMIGHLQTNKARLLAPTAAWVHTLDSAPLARELAKRLGPSGRSAEVLLEVNVAGDPKKSGCSPEEVGPLIDAVRAEEPALRLRGLMTMPPHTEDPEGARPAFVALRALRDQHGGPALLPHLSMGMSHDLEIAVEEGATIVRVGTAIFGARQRLPVPVREPE